jgi:hypothetical protein
MPKLLFVMLPFTVLPMLYQILNLSFINFKNQQRKLVLAARSPVFKAQLLGPTKEAMTISSCIAISDIDPETLEALHRHKQAFKMLEVAEAYECRKA